MQGEALRDCVVGACICLGLRCRFQNADITHALPGYVFGAFNRRSLETGEISESSVKTMHVCLLSLFPLKCLFRVSKNMAARGKHFLFHHYLVASRRKIQINQFFGLFYIWMFISSIGLKLSRKILECKDLTDKLHTRWPKIICVPIGRVITSLDQL